MSNSFKMASYWRSPYREPSNSFRGPDHSTLKFEQSLYLSRSKTSVNSSKYDWLDAAFGSPSPHTHRHTAGLTRSDTNIKSILKPPKRDGCLIPGKQTESNSSGESNNDNNGESPKKDIAKKRVTFGLSKDLEDENDQDESNYSLNKKCQLKAMKRISHSRLLEESAMKRLNRLIGGGGSHIAESSSLPSVKGTGIPSPRHSADSKAPKSACGHSADLRCIRCIRKDVEHNHNDRIYGKANVDDKLISLLNGTSQPRDSVIDSELNDSTQNLEGDVKDWPAHDQSVKDNEENVYAETFPHNREETPYRIANSSTASVSNNSKKHFRLLPGRYPFTTGAMQIKKLSIPDIQKAQRGDSTLTTEKTNVIDMQQDKANVKLGSTNDKNNNELSQRITSRGAATTTNTRSSSASVRIPPVILPAPTVTSAALNNETESIKIGIKGKNREKGYNDSDDEYSSKERRKMSSDKTSDILDWLNDVHQKQTFKSRMPRIHAPES